MKNADTDQTALIAAVYDARHDELLRFAVSRLGNLQDAEDTVHDAFVRLLAYDGIITPATAPSLAFTIVSNKVKDRLRHRHYRHLMEREQMRQPDVCEPVEKTAVFHETLSMVRRCAGTMPPARARVFRMSFFGDMAAGDIAEKLGISKRTVEAQLFASRRQVRDYVRRMA